MKKVHPTRPGTANKRASVSKPPRAPSDPRTIAARGALCFAAVVAGSMTFSILGSSTHASADDTFGFGGGDFGTGSFGVSTPASDPFANVGGPSIFETGPSVFATPEATPPVTLPTQSLTPFQPIQGNSITFNPPATTPTLPAVSEPVAVPPSSTEAPVPLVAFPTNVKPDILPTPSTEAVRPPNSIVPESPVIQPATNPPPPIVPTANDPAAAALLPAVPGTEAVNIGAPVGAEIATTQSAPKLPEAAPAPEVPPVGGEVVPIVARAPEQVVPSTPLINVGGQDLSGPLGVTQGADPLGLTATPVVKVEVAPTGNDKALPNEKSNAGAKATFTASDENLTGTLQIETKLGNPNVALNGGVVVPLGDSGVAATGSAGTGGTTVGLADTRGDSIKTNLTTNQTTATGVIVPGLTVNGSTKPGEDKIGIFFTDGPVGAVPPPPPGGFPIDTSGLRPVPAQGFPPLTDSISGTQATPLADGDNLAFLPTATPIGTPLATPPGNGTSPATQPSLGTPGQNLEFLPTDPFAPAPTETTTPTPQPPTLKELDQWFGTDGASKIAQAPNPSNDVLLTTPIKQNNEQVIKIVGDDKTTASSNVVVAEDPTTPEPQPTPAPNDELDRKLDEVIGPLDSADVAKTPNTGSQMPLLLSSQNNVQNIDLDGDGQTKINESAAPSTNVVTTTLPPAAFFNNSDIVQPIGGAKPADAKDRGLNLADDMFVGELTDPKPTIDATTSPANPTNPVNPANPANSANPIVEQTKDSVFTFGNTEQGQFTFDPTTLKIDALPGLDGTITPLPAATVDENGTDGIKPLGTAQLGQFGNVDTETAKILESLNLVDENGNPIILSSDSVVGNVPSDSVAGKQSDSGGIQLVGASDCRSGPINYRNDNGNDVQEFTPCQSAYAAAMADQRNGVIDTGCGIVTLAGGVGGAVLAGGLSGGLGTAAGAGGGAIATGAPCATGARIVRFYDESFKLNAKACEAEGKNMAIIFKYGGVQREYVCVVPTTFG